MGDFGGVSSLEEPRHLLRKVVKPEAVAAAREVEWLVANQCVLYLLRCVPIHYYMNNMSSSLEHLARLDKMILKYSRLCFKKHLR